MDAGFQGYGPEMHEGEEDVMVAVTGIRKGPWIDEEDALLFNYVSLHGEGRWNSVAVNTGKDNKGGVSVSFRPLYPNVELVVINMMPGY